MSFPQAERPRGPRLLILDDEPVQRMTVHLHLTGLGEFVDFGDPRIALEYLKENEVDAAIVDIRMPSLPVDGVWFLHELRKRDRDLGVVLRTADDSVEIAQAGIESRAVQRVVKSTPDARSRLRSAVELAIRETRERRRAASALADIEETRHQLATVLGRIECDITVAEMCRGFVQGLTNRVATLAGYSELLLEQLGQRDPELSELAARNRATAQALSEQVTAFLSTQYLQANARSTANGCVEALAQIFQSHPLFGSDGCLFGAKGTLPDIELSADATRLISALRHLVEYCAQRASRSVPISVTVARTSNCRVALQTKRDRLVLNSRSASGSPAAVFSIQADLGAVGFDALTEAFRNGSSDMRSGNLLVVSAELLDDHLALDVEHTRKGATVFNLYVPQRT